jgi:hypothetical protein
MSSVRSGSGVGEGGFFIEGVVACLSAKAAHAVKRLFTIPAGTLGRQVLAGTRGRSRCGARRLAPAILVRQTFLYGSQDLPLRRQHIKVITARLLRWNVPCMTIRKHENCGARDNFGRHRIQQTASTEDAPYYRDAANSGSSVLNNSRIARATARRI